MTNPFIALVTDIFSSPEKLRSAHLSHEQVSVIWDRSRIRHLAEEAISAHFVREYPVNMSNARVAETVVAQTHDEALAMVTNISAVAGKATLAPQPEHLEEGSSVAELTEWAKRLAA